MGIGISMLMIAAGAIMRYAITAQAKGFNVHTAGMVLILVGVVGSVLSIAFWASWGGVGTMGGRGGRVVSDERTIVSEQEVR